MNRSITAKIYLIFLITFIVLITPGCSKEKNNEQAKKPDMESMQKAPKEYKSMIDAVESIIEELAALASGGDKAGTQAKAVQKSEKQSPGQGGQEGQDSSSNTDSNSSQSKSSQEKNKSAESGEKSPEDKWTKLAEQLKMIHKDWNMLEPEAIKAGVSVTNRKNFEQALDQLTMEMGGKNTMGSLKAAIELYGRGGSLAGSLKDKVPAEYYTVRYEIMAASLEAAEGKWDQALNRLPDLKDNWDNFKARKIVKDEKMLSRSDLSVDDFEAALSSENMDLILIKAEIALNNLKQIEDSLSKGKSGE